MKFRFFIDIFLLEIQLAYAKFPVEWERIQFRTINYATANWITNNEHK